jgi:release factor glutamine methyltransferase
MFSAKKIYFENYVFEICSNVYEPAEDSFLFAENLAVEQGARVLDMGTGSGILGIIAAARASEVVAIDINPYAITCAKQNSIENGGFSKMSFIRADLFSPLRREEKFNLILFNAPYLPTIIDGKITWLEKAWTGGSDGRDVIDAFILRAPKYLDSLGEILLMQSNLASLEQTTHNFQTQGLQTEIVAKCDMPFFESLFLISAKIIQ